MQKALATSLATLMIAGQMAGSVPAQAQSYGSTSTPIKHLVVIFQENISFDHYFGTYPERDQPARVSPPSTPNLARQL